MLNFSSSTEFDKRIPKQKFYENFVRQIAGGALNKDNEVESLKESVEKDEKRKELEKKIEALKEKIKKEKQLNRQMELNGELKRLRKELENKF